MRVTWEPPTEEFSIRIKHSGKDAMSKGRTWSCLFSLHLHAADLRGGLWKRLFITLSSALPHTLTVSMTSGCQSIIGSRNFLPCPVSQMLGEWNVGQKEGYTILRLWADCWRTDTMLSRFCKWTWCWALSARCPEWHLMTYMIWRFLKLQSSSGACLLWCAFVGPTMYSRIQVWKKNIPLDLLFHFFLICLNWLQNFFFKNCTTWCSKCTAITCCWRFLSCLLQPLFGPK